MPVIFNKPKLINFDEYKLNPLTYGKIKENMLISFHYQSHIVHDKKPVIFVLEVRGNRIYGINLRYKPWLFDQILRDKKKEINNLLDKKIRDYYSKQENKIVLEIEKEDLKLMLEKEIPSFYKEYYNFKLAKMHSDILRNYLKERVVNINQIVFEKKELK